MVDSYLWMATAPLRFIVMTRMATGNPTLAELARARASSTPHHGIWVDNRTGRKPSIVVCDRANHTLQYFTMDGKYLETIKGFGLPANAETHKNLLLIPELQARVTLLDEKNQVVAQLGDDRERVTGKDGGQIRGDSKKWLPGKFVHPHDACFDAKGNIYVAEWVATGRVSMLKKV